VAGRHQPILHAIPDDWHKLFGECAQCPLLRAASEQSFFGDSVGSGDVPLADQAKREVTIEAFAVGFAVDG
jgi:hypothetical protein